MAEADLGVRQETNSIIKEKGIFGRIRDTDSHEMVPASLWAETFGEFARPLADIFNEHMSESAPNSLSVKRVVDDIPIEAEKMGDYWSEGVNAPSSFDMTRRPEFLDAAGIEESMVFGTVMHAFGQQVLGAGQGAIERYLGGVKLDIKAEEYGRMMLRAHNEWCLDVAKTSSRLRPVGALWTEDLDEAMSDAHRLIDGGLRALTVPPGLPVAKRAPAHPDNDPLWQIFADNNVPVVFHIGGERGLVRNLDQWSNAPMFTGTGNAKVPSELPVDPFTLSTVSLGAQYYITNLTMGGVFERIPNLRLAVAEMSANWVGPMAENMDMWAAYFKRRLAGTFSMKPSEYIQRNVRVMPFHFEPVDVYLTRYPFLRDVLTFGSDFPHKEGGGNPIEEMAARIAPLGDEMLEKFFVSNAGWIMP